MLKLLGDLKGYLKYREIVTDCMVFRIHNIITSVLLFTCSMLITASQFVGNPIDCIVQGLPQNVVNTYCWITSTYTMPDAFARQVGSHVPHPGVANDFNDESAKKYYAYYQWVCFVLFFQALMCYGPHLIWSSCEGGLMNSLVMGLNHGLQEEEEVSKKKGMLMDYLLSHIKRHKSYVYRYFICECLCFVNIVVQLYMMNKFFEGEFMTYGLKVIHFIDDPQEDRIDPMVYIFPRVTKCLFHKYGPSGSIQKHDALCILPLNIVNEKTYIVIWFWFLLLSGILFLLIVYRMCIIFMPALRAKLMHNTTRLSIEVCRSISNKIDIGDWWILYMLSSNMDSLIYKEFLEELTKRIAENSKQ